jgi:hypothetical protein
MRIEQSHTIPPNDPGLRIAWNFGTIKEQTVPGGTFILK